MSVAGRPRGTGRPTGRPRLKPGGAVESVRAYLAEHRATATDVGRAIGYSRSAVWHATEALRDIGAPEAENLISGVKRKLAPAEPAVAAHQVVAVALASRSLLERAWGRAA